MMYKAIIFDMDGVLFDTEEFYYKRRQSFLAGKGISIDHIPPSYFVGGNMKQVWRTILGEDYDNWDIQQLQQEYTAYKLANPLPYKQTLFPTVRQVLEEISRLGLKIGLASSSAKGDILRALDETDLTSYFQVLLSGQDLPETKPHPAIYNLAVQLLDVAKEEVLVIEDSEKGIAAAHAAGLEVWAIKDQLFGMDQSKAGRLISDLSQILTLIKTPSR